MTISNETKVGALTAIAITFMILGFNFLKGKTLLKTGNYIYAKYTDTKGIMVSNPVFINGYSVGSVFELENSDKNLSSIVVTIKLKDNYNIATNSIASIFAWTRRFFSARVCECTLSTRSHSFFLRRLPLFVFTCRCVSSSCQVRLQHRARCVCSGFGANAQAVL